MPAPFNDNISGAAPLVTDGEQHVTFFDTTGATVQVADGEDVYGDGWPNVWAKVDLSPYDFFGGFGNVGLQYSLVQYLGSTISPYFSVWAPDFGFDPSAPDWTLLGFVAEGNAGTDRYTTLPFDPYSLGIYELYLSFFDGSYGGTGAMLFTYEFDLPPIHRSPRTHPGTSSTVVVTGTGVYDDQRQKGFQGSSTEGNPPTTMDRYTTSFAVRDVPGGVYNMFLYGTVVGAGPGSSSNEPGDWTAIVRINGHPVAYTQQDYSYSKLAALDGVLVEIPVTGLANDVVGGGDYLALAAGDEVQVVVYLTNWSANAINRHLEIRDVVLRRVAHAAPARHKVDVATVSDLPLGATSWTDAGTAGADIGGVGTNTVQSKRILVTADGTVYVLFVVGAAGTLALWRWSGGAWALVSSTFTGNTRVKVVCDFDTDGTDLWLAWSERDGTSLPFSQPNLKWRCMHYVPSTNTFTELGTGQAHVPGSSRVAGNNLCDAGSYENGVRLRVSPSGQPWVAWGELDPTGSTVRPYLSQWDGTAWQDTGLPMPPSPNAASWTVAGIHVDPQDQVDFVFAHADGPNQYPAVVYSASYLGTLTDTTKRRTEWVYNEYQGGGTWRGTYVWDAHEDFFGSFGTSVAGHTEYGALRTGVMGKYQQGMRMAWDGANIVLAVAMWDGSGGEDRTVVLKLDAYTRRFTAYKGVYQQPDYAWRSDPSAGSWIDPTGIEMVVDPFGRKWVLYDIGNSTWYATTLCSDQDSGGGTGWVPARGMNPIGGEVDAVGFSRITYHDEKLYILVLQRFTNTARMCVWVAPIARAVYRPMGLRGNSVAPGPTPRSGMRYAAHLAVGA